MTTIGNGAFRLCSGFTGNLKIPNSITTIGEDAFRWCNGFTGNLTIPESVTTIERGAFSYCDGIESARFYGNAPTAGDSIFGSRDSTFIVYRLTDKSDWPEAGETWNGYVTAIFER